MSENEYDLRKSTEKIGELYPVIVSKSGEIVDGFHRINAKANWRREVREDIDTPEKVLKARLISNKFRRQVSAVEVRGWINDLAEIAYTEHGIEPGEISGWVAEETGYARKSVTEYLNPEYKKSDLATRIGDPNPPKEAAIASSTIVSVAEPLIREAEPTVDLDTADGLKKAAKALEREAKRKVKAQKTPEQLEAEKAEKKRKKREKVEKAKQKREAKKKAREEREQKIREEAALRARLEAERKAKAETKKKIAQIQKTAKEDAKKELVENPEFIDTLIEENKELFEEKIRKRREEADQILKKRFALIQEEAKPPQKASKLEDQYLKRIQNTFLEITSWNLSLWIGLDNENRETAYKYFQAINQWTQWLINLKNDRNAEKPEITIITKETPMPVDAEYRVVG